MTRFATFPSWLCCSSQPTSAGEAHPIVPLRDDQAIVVSQSGDYEIVASAPLA